MSSPIEGDVGSPTASGRPARVPTSARAVVWLARAVWLAIPLFGGQAVGEALGDHSRAVQLTGTTAAWIGWAAGALALAIPAVSTLTLARTTVPGSLVAAVIALVDRAEAESGIALFVPAAVATVLVGSAEFGRVYIQASAYGDEARFGLRPPIGYAVASAVTWLLTAVALLVTPVALAGKAWLAGAAGFVVAVAGVSLLPVRWHQLSRRWFVFVPAGVVVHDPVVLADTLMIPRRDVTSISLQGEGAAAKGSADLTGPTPGLAVEVLLAKPVTAVLARTPKRPDGTAIDLTAFVISPTRPGAVIRAARRRGYP
ncbi:MAG: hypothetical protein ACRD0G_04100 [Acidimicrobiales bacterium]